MAMEAVHPALVFHLAGISSPDRDRCFAVNLEGTRHLLAAAAALSPPPAVLLVSSAAVYGRIRPEENPVRETTPLRPASPYGESKAAAEELALGHHRAGRVPVVIVRPFNLIGPGLPRGLAPADFVAEAARVRRGEGEPVARVGALTPRRDFVDVRDAVRAYTLLAEHPEARGRAFNVGTGHPVAIGDLLEAILSAAGVTARVETDPARLRSDDVEEMVADTGALRDLTGWRPEIPLADSLREMTA
jgi:GDP-4-dehydro-6-deoxy-D-mannose reductase